MQKCSIILCNEVLGIITGETKEQYEVYTYDKNNIVLDKDASITELSSPYAFAKLVYDKVAKARR